jgi:hypothetical protein
MIDPTDISIPPPPEMIIMVCPADVMVSMMVRAKIAPKAFILRDRGLNITLVRNRRTERIRAMPIWLVVTKRRIPPEREAKP